VLPSSWLLAPVLSVQVPAPGAAPAEVPVHEEPATPESSGVAPELCARVRISTDSTEAGFRDAIEAQLAEFELPLDFGGEGIECARHVSFGLRRDTSDAYFEIFVEDTLRPTQRIVRTLGPVSMNSYARDEMFALIVRRCLVAAMAGENIEVEQARIEARALADGAFQRATALPDTVAQPRCEVCPEPLPPADVATAAPPELRRNWLLLDVDYLGRTWAQEIPWQHAALLSLGWEHISGAEVQLGGALTRATELEDDAVFLRIAPIGLRLSAGYRRGWEGLSVAVRAGLLADGYARRTLARQSGVLLTEDGRRWNLGGILAADMDLRLLGPLRLHGGVGAQWFPGAFDFTVEEAGVSRTLLSLEPVRVEARLGLRVQI
jgi:hypothetical protein